MSDLTSESEPVYHLFVDPEEMALAASSLRLLISGESHQPEIRRLARGVLARLQADPGQGVLSLPLDPQEMKITHTAVRLLLKDLQREQSDERAILWRILNKLPDEHAIRAITLE